MNDTKQGTREKPRTELRQPEITDELLREHSPSQLDEVVKKTCPSFEDKDSDITSAYSSLHSAVQGRILVELQLDLEELEVSGESERDGYSLDGTAGIKINDKKAEIEGEGGKNIAVIEVKTGNIKPFQAAAYAYLEGVPVLIAEVQTGDVHVVDENTSNALLNQFVEHKRNLKQLEKKEKLIPGRFQCSNCSKSECSYYRESSFDKEGILEEKSNTLSNIPEIVEGLREHICSIVKSKGYSVTEASTPQNTATEGA